MKGGILALLLFVISGAAQSQGLLMARSHQSFPEAMLVLQAAIGEHGYQVSRVQRVDIGLTNSGFKTDKYRIVFFGKPEEVRRLSTRYPQLVPYLPQKITIFAEGAQTLLVTVDPVIYATLVTDPAEQPVFARWRKDMQAILDEVAAHDE